MLHKISKSWMNVPQIFLLFSLIMIPPLSPLHNGGTHYTDQTFGTKDVSQVRGIRADVWTAQQPGDWYAINSPVGICTTTFPCTGHYFETGYIKGTITKDNPTFLQQYAAWKDPDGTPQAVYHLGNLSDNTMYRFQSLYSNTAQRWEAWRDGNPVFYPDHSLGFQNGSMVVCGAEGGGTGVPLGVQCLNMSYRVGTGAWTLYNYVNNQHTAGYCAYEPYDFSVVAWGPGC